MVQVALRIGNRSRADVTKHTGCSECWLRSCQPCFSMVRRAGKDSQPKWGLLQVRLITSRRCGAVALLVEVGDDLLLARNGPDNGSRYIPEFDVAGVGGPGEDLERSV